MNSISFKPGEPNEVIEDERLFSWRRIRRTLAGAIVAIVAGAVLVSSFTYMQYGGTPFDRFFPKKEFRSPAEGKLAFDKNTKYYIGIIRGERSLPRRGRVYDIEQAGGSMMEVSKDIVEVREREKDASPAKD